MVKSKQNTKKAVFIAALLLSVLASALAPVFMQGEEAQGRFKWYHQSRSVENSESESTPDKELPPIEKGPDAPSVPLDLPPIKTPNPRT